jgi:hypothetical protein
MPCLRVFGQLISSIWVPFHPVHHHIEFFRVSTSSCRKFGSSNAMQIIHGRVSLFHRELRHGVGQHLLGFCPTGWFFYAVVPASLFHVGGLISLSWESRHRWKQTRFVHGDKISCCLSIFHVSVKYHDLCFVGFSSLLLMTLLCCRVCVFYGLVEVSTVSQRVSLSPFLSPPPTKTNKKIIYQSIVPVWSFKSSTSKMALVVALNDF